MTQRDPGDFYTISVRLPVRMAQMVERIAHAVDVPPDHVAAVMFAVGMERMHPEEWAELAATTPDEEQEPGT